jgi:hypothetical protein
MIMTDRPCTQESNAHNDAFAAIADHGQLTASRTGLPDWSSWCSIVANARASW